MRYKILVIIIAAILLLGVIGSVLVLTRSGGDTVQIISDGEVLYTVDLRTAADTTIEIDYHGHTNTVQILSGRIRVLSADCPDGTCVHMGWLHSAAAPIVCLPHHLVIRYADPVGAVDAVTG